MKKLVCNSVILGFFSFLYSVSIYAAVDPRMIQQMKKNRALRAQRQMQAGRSALQKQQIIEYSKDENMRNLIDSFKSSSIKWREISDQRIKEYIVYYFMSDYRRKGVIINKPPVHYVSLLNGMSAQNPGILSNPFDKILEIAAIIEYDFNNGQDKDSLAKKVLGEKGYLSNKKRLGFQ